jgi:hypothetical protein
MSTYDLLQKPVELHMNLRCVSISNESNFCSANGTLINDDGVTLVNDPSYESVTFNLGLTAQSFAEGE